MSTKTYSAPWGLKIGLITGIVAGLGLGVAVGLPFFMKEAQSSTVVLFFPAIAVLTILAGTGLFVVRGFELTDGHLFVQRSFWKTDIDLAGLESATADPTACKGAFKTLGNDGVFAMSGRFYSKKLRSFRAFVTAPKNSVILKFAKRTIVVSPENPKSFAGELNRRLKLPKDKS
jgi:hypothetical protein